MAKVIDGNKVAASIRAECKERVDTLKEKTGVTPGLAVILVGEDPASAVYVRNKIRACDAVGIKSLTDMRCACSSSSSSGCS